MTDRILIASFLVACGGSTTPRGTDVTDVMLTIEAHGSTTSYVGGPIVELVAMASYDGQPAIDVTADAAWESSATDVTAITEPGKITPIGGGAATIDATIDGSTASIDLTVLSTQLIAAGVVFGSPGGSIVLYEPNADGAATPLRRFRSGWSELDSITGVRIANDEIFVANLDNIQVFSVNDGGPSMLGVSPKRKIWGVETKVSKIRNVVVHGAELFTIGQEGIIILPIEATDHTAPLRTITGPRVYSWLEIQGNEIYAGSSDGQIDVFPTTAIGTVSPNRSISTAGPVLGFDVTSSEVFVVTNDNKLRVYSTSAGGLLRTIGIPEEDGVELHAPRVIGNEIYLPHLDGSRITVHAIDADGPSAPLRTITGVGTAYNSTLTHIDVH